MGHTTGLDSEGLGSESRDTCETSSGASSLLGDEPG